MIAKFIKSVPNGVVFAPPSKSYAHRAIICSAFSDNSVVDNIALSDDIKATIYSLEQLGARIITDDNRLSITGIDRNNIPKSPILDANESGSTLRFLIPVCLTLNREIKIKGSKKLLSRPLDEYVHFAKKYGFKFEIYDDFVNVLGDLSAGNYEINGDISSQFVSGLVLALAFCEGISTVKIAGEISSRPYIDITLDVLNSFGIKTVFYENLITIYGKQKSDSVKYTVEGDCSNSCYIEALSFLGGNVAVKGLNEATVQGDIVYKEMFVALKNGKRHFDLSDCPDLAPIMFSLSCLFGGAKFSGTRRLKYKESDRCLAMSEELKKFGVQTEIYDDYVIIKAQNIFKPNEILFSHNDHRIVMALSVLCAKYGGIISGAEAVNKSYPDYFDEILKIGVDVSYDA